MPPCFCWRLPSLSGRLAALLDGLPLWLAPSLRPAECQGQELPLSASLRALQAG